MTYGEYYKDTGTGEGGKKLMVVDCLKILCKAKIEKHVHGKLKYK